MPTWHHQRLKSTFNKILWHSWWCQITYSKKWRNRVERIRRRVELLWMRRGISWGVSNLWLVSIQRDRQRLIYSYQLGSSMTVPLCRRIPMALSSSPLPILPRPLPFDLRLFGYQLASGRLVFLRENIFGEPGVLSRRDGHATTPARSRLRQFFSMRGTSDDRLLVSNARFDVRETVKHGIFVDQR